MGTYLDLQREVSLILARKYTPIWKREFSIFETCAVNLRHTGLTGQAACARSQDQNSIATKYSTLPTLEPIYLNACYIAPKKEELGFHYVVDGPRVSRRQVQSALKNSARLAYIYLLLGMLAVCFA